MIYLDHAATTPVPRAVADAMYEVLAEQYANPSAQYRAGLDMKKRVDGWRETVASALGCQAEELFFTSCGTESDAWAVAAARWQNRRRRHIVATAVEHSAVLESCKWAEREGWTVTYVSPGPDGAVSAADVLDAVGPDTALVSVMLVNNELGNRYPVEEIAAGVRKKNPEALVHTDAVQGFLKVPFQSRTLGADFVSVSAHKIGGPKGIGALYIGPRVRNPRPLLPGGGQEGGVRSGTEATAQIAGFAAAVETRQAVLAADPDRMERLYRYAAERLSDIPDLVLLGAAGGKKSGQAGGSNGNSGAADGSMRDGADSAAAGGPVRNDMDSLKAAGGSVPYAPHILAFALAGWPSQNVVNDLSEQGICLSAGSACHRGRPSHVTAALKLPKRVERSVLRMSFGPETTEADIDACAAALRRHHDQRMPML